MDNINSFYGPTNNNLTEARAPLKIDMASALKTNKCFSGLEEEDPMDWVLEVRMLERIAEISDGDLAKLMLLKLRGVAQTWAAQYFVEGAVLDLECVLEVYWRDFIAQPKPTNS